MGELETVLSAGSSGLLNQIGPGDTSSLTMLSCPQMTKLTCVYYSLRCANSRRLRKTTSINIGKFLKEVAKVPLGKVT